MNSRDRFPNDPVDDRLTGNSKPGKHRLTIQPVQKFNEENYQAEPFSVSNVAKRDSASIRDVDVSDSKDSGSLRSGIGDDVFSYFQKIARTPRLTQEEERKLFEAFSARTQEISELLKRLPPQILAKVQSTPGTNRRKKTNASNVRWWSPMEIRPVLAQISAAYQTSQNRAVEGNPVEKDAIQMVWHQLAAAVAGMEAVREKIVCGNLLLVASVVMHYRAYTPSLSLLDLMQEGSIGLMKAVEKFDLQKGCKFGTYAYWWIRQGIQRALAQQSHTIRTPDYIGPIRQSITKAQMRLFRELEREPSVRETALAVGIDEDRVAEILQGAKDAISLASPFFDSVDTTLCDMLTDESHATPEEELLCIGKKESLEKVLDTLTPREKIVIQLRYGLTDGTEHTLAEVGQHLGISRERVRQIQEEVLRKLRQPTRCQPLKELL